MNLFKRTTASIALVALVSGVFSTGVSAYDASELVAANALAAKGYINSQNDASGYNLDATITRAEMAKVAANIAGLNPTSTCENKFADVSATTPNVWVCGYAEALLANGLVSANANFNPNANISKSEAVKLMLSAAGEVVSFNDATWQADHVNYAVENGFVASFTDYNTSADRGFVFGTAAAATTEEEEGDILSELEELLAGGDDDEETTSEETTSEESTISGDDVLEVTLSADTAEGATVPASVNGLPVASFDFTAGSEDVTVTQITVKRRGLSDKNTLLSLAIYSDTGRASNEKNDNQENDTEAQLNLSDGGLVVKAGETRTLTVVVDLNTATLAGQDEFALELVNVVASSSVEGLGDVVANTMRVGSVDAPKITFDKGSSVSDPKIGEEDADIFEFEIKGANDEDVIVKKITFEGSSDAEDDLANFKLYYNNDLVAETAFMRDDYLTFDLGEGILIEEDKTEDFTVTADIIEGASDQISFRIDESLDVTAVSTKFGYGAAVDIDDVDTFITDLGEITIEAGELTIVEIEADFDEIKEDKENVVLGKIKVTNVAGQNLELQEFGIKIVLDNAGVSTLPSGSAGSLTVTELFDDVELYNEETGSSYELTPGSVTTTGGGNITTAIFSENNIDVLLAQGTTLWAIRADTADEVDDFDASSFTISFETGRANASTEGSFYVEETEDDEEVTDITPSSISFNTIDGAESGATTSLIPLSASIDVVRGGTDIVAIQFEIEADESSEITIDEIIAKVTAASVAFSSSNKPNQSITVARLYKGSVTDANLLDQESGSNIADDGTINFNDFDDVLIASNQTQEFVITLSIVDASSAVTNGDLNVELIGLDIEDEDNDDVFVFGADGTTVLSDANSFDSSRDIVVNNAGKIVTLLLDTANDDNEFDKLSLAGESIVIASYDVRADNEEVDVETVVFTIANAVNLKNTVINATLLLDGVEIETNTNGDITNTTITFEDMTGLILPETTSELSLRLNTANIGQDFVGAIQAGLTVTDIVISDAEGADSGKDLPSSDIIDFSVVNSATSKTLDIVSAVTIPSIVSTFGVNDQTAELRLTVNGGNNTTANGDAVQAELTSLDFEISSMSATGTITVFNGNGDNITTGSSVEVLANGTVTVAVSSDSIGNENETYRIETTVEAIIRLAKDGVTYTINGLNSTTTKLENTLEVGQYADSSN